MLTGTINKFPLVEDDDETFMYGGFRATSRALSMGEQAALELATQEATQQGFVIGAKVKRKHGTPGLFNDVGTVNSFATSFYEGFHLGLPTPVVVMWTSQHSNWTMSYKTSDLELVNDHQAC